MATCSERIQSGAEQEYIVEYFGDPSYLERMYPEDCFGLVSERFAVAYTPGDRVQSGLHGGAYIVPDCYGLVSSAQVLESSGIARVQRQPSLGLYGQGVLVGFIDTGDGV